MVDNALKPCPFCGKPPLGPGDSSYGYWQIACSDDNDCLVQPVVQEPTEAEAIAAWNTRESQHIAPVSEGVVERVRVMAWLGYWRDHMPAEAVKQLQDIAALTPPSLDRDAVVEECARVVERMAVDRQQELERLLNKNSAMGREIAARVSILSKAVSAIDTLEARVKVLEEALGPLLRYHETGGHEGDGSDDALRRARAALKEQS